MDMERSYVRERTIPETKKNKKKGTDYLVKVVYTQVVVCLILFAILYAMGKLSPSSFEEIKAQYHQIMQTDMSAKEVVNAFKAVGRFIILPNEEPTTLTTTQSSEKESTTAKEKTEQTSEEKTTKTGENKETQTTTMLGSGGLDEIITGSETASLAPCFITAPISIPVSGSISSPYGFRIHPITGKEGFHTGMDIAAAQGSRIGAAYYGKVVETDFSSGWGNYVLLEHVGGLTTFYAHCSEILVEPGTQVRQGETIALVGSTGQSTGPHLHFEIRLNGVRHNPAWTIGWNTDAV